MYVNECMYAHSELHTYVCVLTVSPINPQTYHVLQTPRIYSSSGVSLIMPVTPGERRRLNCSAPCYGYAPAVQTACVRQCWMVTIFTQRPVHPRRTGRPKSDWVFTINGHGAAAVRIHTPGCLQEFNSRAVAREPLFRQFTLRLRPLEAIALSTRRQSCFSSLYPASHAVPNKSCYMGVPACTVCLRVYEPCIWLWMCARQITTDSLR